MNGNRPQPSPLQRLEQALSQWRQWQCRPALTQAPTVQEELQGGLSNHSYLVQAENHLLVVRLDGINPADHGLNRQIEYRVLQTASTAGIAPTPRYFNPDLGAMVVDYHTGQAGERVTAADLAQLLRSIHSLPATHHRVEVGERIRRYLHRLQSDNGIDLPRAYRQRLFALLETTDPISRQHKVLTHNDLMPANLLQSGRHLLALDWEYCGMGSPWFDLAVASLGQDFGEAQQGELLNHYLGSQATASQTLILRQYRSLARYIELLWHLTARPAAEPDTVLQRGLAMIDREA